MIPISLDLRKRVIEYIKQGSSYSSASRKFEISDSSAHRWYKRYKETGKYEAKPFPGSKGRIEKREFTSYVDKHPNATLAQIGTHFKMTARSIHCYMKKYGYSYKKKSCVTWKQRNPEGENTLNE
ncbi:MAG TPA: IS630 transposase-related protein [Candidatus Megaira endosymbiont of Nemacystus decipiens]|nr:IS630 transposase-related protein [Candidatus Megaera endosymbiont of Nemacystus decipiens]